MPDERNFLEPGAILIGPFGVSETVITTWGIMLVLWLLCLVFIRRLKLEQPGPVQTAVEYLILAIERAVTDILPQQGRQVLPFIATLWLFLAIANLSGLVPGLSAPTRDLSTTSALAALVFLSVHWFGIRSQGLRHYLAHYVRPSPILLPFHIIGEITRTLALAIRLFGNMMSLEMAALLVLLVAGFLVPVPILMLHVVEALVQAYLFGMLALIYVASGIQSQQTESLQEKRNV
ncbi:MAG: F0F1 ATP synthase subunit A [Gammaproteobacteria bacterium]|nr:MAG: F0F1 ATP synthase subunit A [Gammaproteobacteria bacterium]